ncbi:nidogen-like domain-containing protein [Tuwongella immobilis]|uniref:NIDO domain-containing protein n=1 Tax=Tuwongella immobilis TaxID=692036 RepID=A0A6C2YQF8_9BACT|nr:nidogen-like domain-containing protein [Tuwongella immobilis]VIP03245.1 outer membrane autotransporter barrel domain protein : Outer membrane autotransporter barrel domain protein OS=Microcystis aeruginosa PCC 9809 GN=MICAH_5530001 PE=4 SV=1: NIDO: VPEP [Tuwongella immobilis]VTS03822.1 outer membrane autotransporter barrel domain protein : Outer membrane autotransporter barrel domain protein OS=Microcystis aeruginosa PCC 9809 GN=MICAH_5530001 PE=4 SV=1: NIDO: VPEP [Tuwongella immobilis]
MKAFRDGRAILAFALLGIGLGGNLVHAEPIRSGYASTTLPTIDDTSSPAVDLGFSVKIYGQEFSQVYVNENGNLTFGAPLAQFTPTPLSSATTPILAPFFADVDVSLAGQITYGTGTVEGRPAFFATWTDVGYYATIDGADKRNDFQVVIIDRSDLSVGEFDLEFNYGVIEWESGDFSGGADGLGGTTARVGFGSGSSDSGQWMELDGSGLAGALLSGGANDLNQSTIRYSFENGLPVLVRNPDPDTGGGNNGGGNHGGDPVSPEVPEPASWALAAMGVIALFRWKRLSLLNPTPRPASTTD